LYADLEQLFEEAHRAFRPSTLSEYRCEFLPHESPETTRVVAAR
jgi:hypothetical protein